MQPSASEITMLLQVASSSLADLIAFSNVYIPRDRKTYGVPSSTTIEQAQVMGSLDSIENSPEERLDDTTVLFTLKADESVLVKHSILKSPVPLVKDRDFVYVEIKQRFVDAKGRPGYAWFRKSTTIMQPTQPASSCTRAVIKSWGAVYVQVSPSALSRFAIMDIDWNGSMMSWVAKRMTTSRKAASTIRPSAPVSSSSPATAAMPSKRCAVCYVKPRMFEKGAPKLTTCLQCCQIVCEACCDEHVVCFCCQFAQRKRNVSMSRSSETTNSSVSYPNEAHMSPNSRSNRVSTQSNRQRRERRQMSAPTVQFNVEPVVSRAHKAATITDLNYVSELY
ncbi:unnamed protein product [Aphanomyces euteiches]